jgi:phospholipid/cholesterol/gamma-HCH transport system ATP-binding protein
MIVVDRLSKRFDDKVVLDQVSFEVKDNQNLVILGPTGTGKTVLLKIIIGLLAPDAGEVRFDQRCVQHMDEIDLLELRKNVGFCFQSTALFDSMTVYENIALSLEEHTSLNPHQIEGRVATVLELIRMTGNEDLYPRSLSGGMKRLVSIGRALAMDPTYILYDEPTSGLDPLATSHICDVINRLRDEHKKCSIIVTHDLDSARKVGNMILMLRNGKITKADRELGKLYA